MKITPLSAHETAVWDANLVVELDHTDLTETTATTAQVIELFDVDKYKLVELVHADLITPFQDVSDSASIITAITVGDGGNAARLLASMELNVNGTEIFIKAGTGVKYNYTTADTVDVTFIAPTEDKALANIDAGKVLLYFRVLDTRGF